MATKLTVVPTPGVVVIKGKSMSIQGWRFKPVTSHLQQHLTQVSDKWCTPECMAAYVFHRNSPENREAVRHRVSRLTRPLIKRKEFLLIDYDDSKEGKGRIKAIKLYEGGENERALAKTQLDRMLKRHQMSQELVTQALAVLDPQPE